MPRFGADIGDDAAYGALLRDIAAVAPPGFGLAVGLRRRMSDLGVLGHVTMSCATLTEVFKLWMIFADSAGELVTFDAMTDCSGPAPTWSLIVKPFSYLEQPVADLLADELCAAFFVFAQEMTGQVFSDFAVSLSHAPSPGVDYASAFPGGLSFDATTTCVTGPACAMDLPVIQCDGDAFAGLIDDLGSETSDAHRASPITRQLFRFLARRQDNPPTLGAAAAALRLSQRTLVRRLTDEQTSYGAIVDEFRRRYALTLAQYGGLKAKQIAHLVGFRSENSLRKAFKKWTGHPIGAWAPPRLDDGNATSSQSDQQKV